MRSIDFCHAVPLFEIVLYGSTRTKIVEEVASQRAAILGSIETTLPVDGRLPHGPWKEDEREAERSKEFANLATGRK
jgi:hypothetical protein